jgi:hypothetical protein
MDVNTELAFLWWLTNSVIQQNKYIDGETVVRAICATIIPDADFKIGEEVGETGHGEGNSHLTSSTYESNYWTVNDQEITWSGRL